ncbi:hypothetical protein [Streptomyces sp. NPDC047841]|uniref:hypothetical protein n=1 Tax=Streptomyces sp. NPDC047841 TaxID=3154708 RepID=UPI0034558D8F
MNRILEKGAVLPVRQPARLVAGVLGAVILLLGAVPLAGRFLAHLQVWTLAVPVPGLSHLLVVAAGTAVLCVALRRSRATDTHSDS